LAKVRVPITQGVEFDRFYKYSTYKRAKHSLRKWQNIVKIGFEYLGIFRPIAARPSIAEDLEIEKVYEQHANRMKLNTGISTHFGFLKEYESDIHSDGKLDLIRETCANLIYVSSIHIVFENMDSKRPD